MKKALLLLASAALLMVGCAKEQLSKGPDGGMTSVTFTASLESVVATKALADGDGNGAYVNRCIMEIYYGDELYKRMVEPTTNKIATFANVPVVAGKQYKILFWADHVDNPDEETGLATDKYYDTDTLKNVQIIKENFIAALEEDANTNDYLDAFFGAKDYTVAQAGGNFNIKLHRPFAQLNVITTDVASGKTVTSAALLPETVSVSYTAATTFNVADSTVTGSTTYAYVAPVYGDKSNWTAVKNRGELTLSMDYILANNEQGLVNVAFSTSTGMSHSLTNLPYQRNYRTNVKGDLLTTNGTWKATIAPAWTEPDIVKVVEVADIKSANQIINQYAASTKQLEVKFTGEPNDSGVPAGEEAGKRAIVTTPIQQDGSLSIEVLAQTRELYIGDYPDEYTVANTVEANHAVVNINVPQSSSIVTLVINAPSKSVYINGKEVDNAGTITSLDAITSQNTLIIEKDQTVGTLTIRQGGLEIHGMVGEAIVPEGHGTILVRDCENLKETEVYNVLKDHIAPGYVGVKGRTTADKWDIIPVVCKIGTKSYGSLVDAVAAVQSGETINLVRDYEGDGVVVPGGKNFTLDFGGHTYKVIDNMAGSTGTQNQCFQLLKGSTLVFQNGTITTSCAKLGINTYSDIIIKDLTIDMTGTEADGQVACLETCNGNVSIEGNTNLIAKEGQIATLVLYWPNGGYGDINLTINTTGEVSGLMAYGSYQVQDLSTVAQHSHVAIKNGKYDCTFDMDGLESYDYKISGGVFTSKPDESLAADKYEVTENTDTATKDRYPWAIVPGSAYVAQIGSELYTSVQEAFKASKDNETIVLLKDTNRGSDQYTSKCGNNITFDLNGHKIESNNGQGVFHFQMSSYKTINFVDTKGNGGLVQLDSNPSSDTYGAICANGANVNIYAGYYETTPAYHGWTQVLYAKDGNITVYDGTFVGDLFTDNQWHHMFPDWAPEANTIEIFGGVFTGKVLDSYAEDGVKSEVVIHGGKFSFNPTDYLAQGEKLVAEQGEDGYWTVSVEKIRAVDLGLSVEWGDRNVGATVSTDHGDYFAWGETIARADAGDWSLYKYYDESSDSITKYNTTDQIYVLKPEDDAASAWLGGGWRMPTKAEMEELFNSCTKEVVANYNDSGVKGLLFTAPNGQTLFIPASGNIWDQIYNSTYEISCWCADKPTEGSAKAYAFDYISNWIDKDTGFSRCGLMTVRPVRSK